MKTGEKTRKVRLAYGRDGLVVNLPADRATIVEPTYVPGLPDPAGAIRDAIRNPLSSPPLRHIAAPHHRVAISVCDITRPMPSATLLPVLLRELRHIPPQNITILIAAGTHRPTTQSELTNMLGPDIPATYQVINHSAFDQTELADLGATPTGIPIHLNRHWVDADIRITTGFVEPHFFAGFSGGPKMIAPGLAGFPTTMRLHSAPMIAHPNARWAITRGNPIHDAVREIAHIAAARAHFSVDVTINREQRITSVYAGEMFATHSAACAVARRLAMRPVARPFDVVLTTNSGYPLDQNLYQAVKGMSAAAQVVRDGGTIICAAECSDGIPAHGKYAEILASRQTPAKLLDMITRPGYANHDQWQVQIQAQIQLKAHVRLKAGPNLTPAQIRRAHLTPISDIESAIAACGDNATICVLPEGPQTIPYLETE